MYIHIIKLDERRKPNVCDITGRVL